MHYIVSKTIDQTAADQFSDEETARRRDAVVRQMARTPNPRVKSRKKIGTIIPDMDEALVDLEELINLSKLSGFDLFGEFQRLADSGTPHLVAQADDKGAPVTGRLVVRYKLAERLQACMAALRTLYGDSSGIKSGCRQSKAPSVSEP
jgi:hypothetical protein